MTAPGPTEETRERQAEVRRVLRAEGWGPHIVDRLCKEWGVKPRSIRKYRLGALREMKAEADEDRAAGVEALAFAEDVERHIDRAVVLSSSNGMGPVASLLRVKQTVLGIEKAPQEQAAPQEEDIVETVALLLRSDAEMREAVTEALAGEGWVLTLERVE